MSTVVYPLIIQTPAGVDTSTSTFTYSNGTQPAANQPVFFELENPGVLPAPLSADVTYFLINITSTTFQLSLTSGGGALSILTAGSGNMSMFSSGVPIPVPGGNYPTPPAINPITEAAKAGAYPARRFNKRERKIVQSVTSYVPGAVVPGAGAGFVVQPTTIEGALDQLASQGSGGTRRTTVATYDFTLDGGATGTIPLGLTLPANCVITEVLADWVVATTGTAGGTLTLNLTTDGNISTAFTTPQATGPVDENSATASTTLPKKTTGARAVNAVIATHALTAGKCYFYITYTQSAAT